MCAKKINHNTEISRLLKFDGNPRRITKKQFELLKDHLETLGDLGGVVYCHNHKAYVGGNQRSEIFDGAEIQIIEKYDEPTAQKTIAHGFINYNGEKFAYREVFFDDYEFRMAFIVANNDGGENDWEELANAWDSDELQDWGLFIPQMEEEEPEEEKTSSPKEENDMIAITLTEDELEAWLEVKEALNCKKDKPALIKLIEFFKEKSNEKDIDL